MQWEIEHVHVANVICVLFRKVSGDRLDRIIFAVLHWSTTDKSRFILGVFFHDFSLLRVHIDTAITMP